jgi:hypothetical protein
MADQTQHSTDHPILGTWKLKSYVATTAAGAESRPYGERPLGYLSYSAEGRMHAIGTADGRFAARHPATPTDGDLAALQRTMFAYAGAFTVEADRVIHHVDVSWNQSWNGTDQIRFFAFSGNRLTLTSRGIDPLNGAETTYVVVFERIRAMPSEARAPAAGVHAGDNR